MPTPVRAQVPGDVAAAKKGKGRVVDEKSVTQCNSAWVSFANRVENGGSFAKEPAARGLRRGPRRVLRVHVGRTPEWAEPFARVPRCEIGFSILQ